jgi:hypothetical protein
VPSSIILVVCSWYLLLRRLAKEGEGWSWPDVQSRGDGVASSQQWRRAGVINVVGSNWL